MKSEEIIEEYIRLIEKYPEENRRGAKRVQSYLDHSALYYQRHSTSRFYALQIPKVFTKEQIAAFEKITETMHGICCKVISEYLHCADYRKLFPFSKELEELILVPNQYDGLLPMARFDIFYQEDTGKFYFCEINTDGTSAMNEDRIFNEALIVNPAHQRMLQKYSMKSFELFDSWADTFLELYQTYEKAEKGRLPQVAILDFLDNGTIHEFEEFARHFQAKGMLCAVCDIRDVSYRDGKLFTPQGMQIDAVYRRAVTSDIMKRYDDAEPFLQAVREQNVFLAGSFCTQIIHNKWLFYILHLERTKRFLSDSEAAFIEEHVPRTGLLEKSDDFTELIANKDEYIIKPLDLYAAKGVYAGVEYDDAAWRGYLEQHASKDYIYQKYCPQYRTKNIDFVTGDGSVQNYINMEGLFCYNGKLAGIYSRMSAGDIIVSYKNERTVPALVLQGNRKDNI
ncbi:MAG: glutathionylspermidine synthase family protein [Clostridiaceae bacterium]|nr:glutathionylspermidine synthase family protein [Clostridiaceae bacterium]